MEQPQQTDEMKRRTVLGLAGGTVLGLLAGTAGASEAGLTSGASAAGAASAFDGAQNVMLDLVGRYESGLIDEGAAEIVAYHAPTQRVFVVNAAAVGVDVLDVTGIEIFDEQDNEVKPNLSNLDKVGEIDVKNDVSGVSSANSVATSEDLVAVALEADIAQDPGQVGFYDPDSLELLGTAPVGPLPDKVTFTPDGERVLVANEGEPTEDYAYDPRGSISIVDISDGVDEATVDTAGFERFNGREDQLRRRGIRIFGPNASASQDFEPEYVTISDDSRTAWVGLQENNAIAEIDIRNARVRKLLPLGFKDHSLAGNELDASNEDGGVNIRNWPINGIRLPDGIGAYNPNGQTYIVTANEGDARDYDSYSEEVEISELRLDPDAFDFDQIEGIDSIEELRAPENLGAKNATTTLGDVDGDGLYEELYVFGSRSFSIFTTDSELVFDSGNDFEDITAEKYGDQFNNNDDENEGDSRSDNKGPEPEGLALGQIGDRHYAFIGLERMGGVMLYDITDPENATFVDYINNRDVTPDLDLEDAGDLGAEGLDFATADERPTDDPLVFVGHEISGTTTIFRVKGEADGEDDDREDEGPGKGKGPGNGNGKGNDNGRGR